jgi:hypothetical protein
MERVLLLDLQGEKENNNLQSSIIIIHEAVPNVELLLTSKAALISVSVGAAGGICGISSSISAGTGVVRLLPPELLKTLTYDAGNHPSCRLRPLAY